MSLVEDIHSAADSLGLLVGVAPARPAARDLSAYRAWLARGDHGGMGYMARPERVARRCDPALILPGARSVICAAIDYCPAPPPTPTGDGPHGRVARYAWGDDYHDWLLPRLGELARGLGGGVHYRAYVDTGPVLERAFAAAAGLGFVGKNTCLIHPHLGSWLFLGVILVDVELPPLRAVIPPRCGTCTRCLDACPTGALAAPYRLDARRCISYLTIEHEGDIPADLRPLLGDRVYGCDDCQVVCPWQRFSRPTWEEAFHAVEPGRARPDLVELLALDEAGFARRFGGTPLERVGRARLARNAAVALGNAGDRRAVAALTAALDDVDPLVRDHAAWALDRGAPACGWDARTPRGGDEATDDSADCDLPDRGSGRPARL